MGALSWVLIYQRAQVARKWLLCVCMASLLCRSSPRPSAFMLAQTNSLAWTSFGRALCLSPQALGISSMEKMGGKVGCCHAEPIGAMGAPLLLHRRMFQRLSAAVWKQRQGGFISVAMEARKDHSPSGQHARHGCSTGDRDLTKASGRRPTRGMRGSDRGVNRRMSTGRSKIPLMSSFDDADSLMNAMEPFIMSLDSNTSNQQTKETSVGISPQDAATLMNRLKQLGTPSGRSDR